MKPTLPGSSSSTDNYMIEKIHIFFFFKFADKIPY